MTTEEVRFHSADAVLAGTLKLPGSGSPPFPAVVHGPGWLGLRDAKAYLPYHDALLAAAIAVLVFDYRGFGDSTGDGTWLDPMLQVADWRAAVDYVQTRPEIDPRRIGAFGSGGTGGGNAIVAAALDARIGPVVSQVPIADGRDWLHRMRREYEWLEFLEQIRQDRLTHATTGEWTMVAPREGIMIATPERKASTIKADVDDRIPPLVRLASAEAILAYRPIDYVARIAPRGLMVIAVENDATTPEDHAYALYERAGGPKRLIIQTGTTHYAAYAYYRDVVNPLIVEWFQRCLVSGEVLVHERAAEAEIVRLDRPASAPEGGTATQ
jgi:dipeptidyl aminopeptidase/acylaminoacyl peptidase